MTSSCKAQVSLTWNNPQRKLYANIQYIVLNITRFHVESLKRLRVWFFHTNYLMNGSYFTEHRHSNISMKNPQIHRQGLSSKDCFALKSQNKQLLHQLEICWSAWHQKYEDRVFVVINDEIKMHTVLLQPLSTEGHVSLFDDVNENLAGVERRFQNPVTWWFTPHSIVMLLFLPLYSSFLRLEECFSTWSWHGGVFHTSRSRVTVLEAYHTKK